MSPKFCATSASMLPSSCQVSNRSSNIPLTPLLQFPLLLRDSDERLILRHPERFDVAVVDADQSEPLAARVLIPERFGGCADAFDATDEGASLGLTRLGVVV